MDAAYKTFEYWSHNNNPPGLPQWAPDAPDIIPEEFGGREHGVYGKSSIYKRYQESKLAYHYDPWNPASEKREQYLKAIHDGLSHHLKDELDRIESLFQDAGSKPAPRSRETDKHFCWLVQFQINRMSHKKITMFHYEISKEEVSEQAVANGVKHAAKLLVGARWEQWLRPCSRGGRPRINEVRATVIEYEPEE